MSHPHHRSFCLEQMKATTEKPYNVNQTQWSTNHTNPSTSKMDLQCNSCTSGPGNITEEGGKIVGVRKPGSLLRLCLLEEVAWMRPEFCYYCCWISWLQDYFTFLNVYLFLLHFQYYSKSPTHAPPPTTPPPPPQKVAPGIPRSEAE